MPTIVHSTANLDPGHVAVQHFRMPIDRRRPQRAETLLSHSPSSYSLVWCFSRVILSIKIMNRSGDNTHPLPKTNAYSNQVRLTAIDSNIALTIIVQRPNGCKKAAIDPILFQDAPQQVSRYPIIDLFQVYKHSIDWIGDFPSLFEDLAKSEQLVSCSSSWTKATLSVLDLWLDYRSAFPLQNFCIGFSREV